MRVCPSLTEEVPRHHGQELAVGNIDVRSPASAETCELLAPGKTAVPAGRQTPMDVCPTQHFPQSVPGVDCREHGSKEQAWTRELLLAMRRAACNTPSATEPRFWMLTKLRPLSWGTLVKRVLTRDSKCTLLDGLCLLGHSRHLAAKRQTLSDIIMKSSSSNSSSSFSDSSVSDSSTCKNHLAPGLPYSTQLMMGRILIRDPVWVSVFPDLARHCHDGLAARIGSASPLDNSRRCTVRVALNPRCALHRHGVRAVAFRREVLPQWSKGKEVQSQNLYMRSGASSPSRTMKTLDTLPDMPDRLTHSQQWRTMNTYDSLPDMPDIMSATWSPFTGPGPPASIGGTPSSVPPPGAPPRQHGNSSAAACDSLPRERRERFRKDPQADRQQVISLNNDSLSSTWAGRDNGSTTYKGSATCESTLHVGSNDPFAAFTRTHDNFDGVGVGGRWGCGTRTCDDGGAFFANKDSLPVPYIPTVDNFDCLGPSRSQLGMKTFDELPAPYTPTHDNLDMTGLSRGCSGANRELTDHTFPTCDNFNHPGFPASVTGASPCAVESLPEIVQSHSPPCSLLLPTHDPGTLQESEQTFRWRA